MQHHGGCRLYHTACCRVCAASVRVAAGGLIAFTTAIISVLPGAAAELPDAVDAANGGTATTSGTSTLAAGDIYGGGNNGNTVIFASTGGATGSVGLLPSEHPATKSAPATMATHPVIIERHIRAFPQFMLIQHETSLASRCTVTAFLSTRDARIADHPRCCATSSCCPS